MTANVNPVTGIRYGVLQGQSCPELLEDIQQNGTNETFEAHKRQCIAELVPVLTNHGQRLAEKVAAGIVDDYEWDNYECDEEEYSYDDGKGNKYLVGWLGGAPLIWITQSTCIVHVKALCSPCVPNAGDLDSGIVLAEQGYECYGLPDGYMIEE